MDTPRPFDKPDTTELGGADCPRTQIVYPVESRWLEGCTAMSPSELIQYLKLTPKHSR